MISSFAINSDRKNFAVCLKTHRSYDLSSAGLVFEQETIFNLERSIRATWGELLGTKVAVTGTALAR